MPGRPHIYIASTIVDVNESAINTETVALTLAGCSSEFAGQQIALYGAVSIVPGTTPTSMTVRIRQDSLAGTVVGEANVAAGGVAAGARITIPCFGIDPAAEIAGRSYVVTFQGAGEGTVAVASASQLSCTIS